MTPRCEQCGRRLTNDASRALGIGPTCLERLRARGLVVGGKQRQVREPKVGVRGSRGWAGHPDQRDWVREIGV